MEALVVGWIANNHSKKGRQIEKEEIDNKLRMRLPQQRYRPAEPP